MISENKHKNYIDWFEKTLVKEMNGITVNTEKQCFFLTMAFNRSRKWKAMNPAYPYGLTSYEPLFTDFEHIYSSICRTIAGRNYSRPNKLLMLPRAVVAVDVEGTRQNSPPTTSANSNWHLHAVLTVSLDAVDGFNEFIKSSRFIAAKTVMSDVDDLDIEPFDSRKGSFPKLVDYATKYLRFEDPNKFDQLAFRIYPKNMAQSIVSKAAPVRQSTSLAKLRSAAKRDSIPMDA